VGLGIYKDKSKIKTATAKEMVRKKSRRPLGSGTIIIKRIANTKKTTPMSVTSFNNLKALLTLFTSSHPYYVF